MPVQVMSVTLHICMASVFRAVQLSSSSSVQYKERLAMLRSRYCNLLDSMVVVGNVGSPEVELMKMSGFSVALDSLRTSHPLDRTCPNKPGGTVA